LPARTGHWPASEVLRSVRDLFGAFSAVEAFNEARRLPSWHWQLPYAVELECLGCGARRRVPFGTVGQSRASAAGGSSPRMWMS
jgi:hypothetical protein